jgi:hypothetical protein
MKSRGMRFTGHVAWMGERRVAYRVLVGNPGGKRPFARLCTEWRKILNWIVKYSGGCDVACFGSGYGYDLFSSIWLHSNMGFINKIRQCTKAVEGLRCLIKYYN